MSQLTLVDDTGFAEATQSGLVLVDFFAEWCGPCHMQTPILEELAQEMADQVSVIKVDIDKAQKVTAQHQITSVPTLILLKDGQEVERMVGLRDLDALKSIVQNHS